MKPFTYQLLERIAELYADVSLKDVLLLACQHLLDPQKRMFEILLRAGLKPENCIVAGKSYSTNPEVMGELKDMGCVVAPFSHNFEPTRLFGDWFNEKLCSFMEQELRKRRPADYRKIIILDDGGFLHCVADRVIADTQNVVGIEQTSSGHNKIEKANISFPSRSVARSIQKQLYESPYIGALGARHVTEHIRKRGKKDPNILVIGLGAIGRQTAGQLLIVRGLNGFATDLKAKNGQMLGHGATELLTFRNKVLAPEAALERLAEFDVIVGATGSPVLLDNDIEKLHPAVSLLSMSSSDNEFPPLPFRHPGGRIHDDYFKGDRCLANGGFPITFHGRRQEIPPGQIEYTIALLLSRLMHEASDSSLHHLSLVLGQLMEMWRPLEGAEEWYSSN